MGKGLLPELLAKTIILFMLEAVEGGAKHKAPILAALEMEEQVVVELREMMVLPIPEVAEAEARMEAQQQVMGAAE